MKIYTKYKAVNVLSKAVSMLTSAWKTWTHVALTQARAHKIRTFFPYNLSVKAWTVQINIRFYPKISQNTEEF